MTAMENTRYLVQVWRDQVPLDFIRTDDRGFAVSVFEHFCEDYEFAYVEFWDGDTLIADTEKGEA